MSQQTPSTSVLVAEVNKQAVGIMSLTTAIEVHQLRQAFFLEPFNFLKPSESMRRGENGGREGEWRKWDAVFSWP